MHRTIYNADEKLWSGLARPPLYNPNISVGHVLLHAMKSNPKKVAQINANNGVQLTYGELYIQSVRAAQNIQKLGFNEGDVFAVVSKNNHKLAPIIVAMLSTGHPFNTLDPTFTETEVTHMFSLTKPKVVFTETDSYETVTRSLRELSLTATVYTFCGQIGASIPVEDLLVATGIESEFIPVDVCDGEKTAIIVCSSGTTGISKGVCLSHMSLLAQSCNFLDMPTDSVLLCFSTLYWLSGVFWFMQGILNGATRILTTDPFSIKLLFDIVDRYGITHLLTATHHLVLASKCENSEQTNLSSLRHWVVGGSKVPLNPLIAIKRMLPNGEINNAYGMSEVSGVVSLNSPYQETDAVGQIIDNIRVKIVDLNGKRLGIGQSGEICFKPNFKIVGYYGNAEGTAALFDAESFVQTGDIGYFDEMGLLHVTDRKKDFLKYCNYMIAPNEIENVLITHPQIGSACVVGIPDIVATDLPAAVIVRKGDTLITDQQVKDFVANKFADSKKLRGGVYFVDSLPTTASGKVLRREVRQLAIHLYNTYTDK